MMKRVFIFLTVAIIALSANTASAQSFKFGYVNSAELMQALPDIESIQKEMQTYAKDLELTIEELQVEYNKKVDAFQKNEATWSATIKTAKETEINEMRRRVQEQMQGAESDYTTQYQKLMDPVRVKMQNAIKKVGKDNGFTYIFDTSGGVLPFINEAQATSVLDLVKKELKIN